MGTSPKMDVSQQAPGGRQLLTMQEVADHLGVSVQRAYELGRIGLLPVVRLGRQMRVDRRRLEDWVASGGQALPGGWRREPS
jgi:putative molybdopterin biosynthesis protein